MEKIIKTASKYALGIYGSIFGDIFKFGGTRDHLTRYKPLLIASSYALARENTTAYLSEYLNCTQ